MPRIVKARCTGLTIDGGETEVDVSYDTVKDLLVCSKPVIGLVATDSSPDDVLNLLDVLAEAGYFSWDNGGDVDGYSNKGPTRIKTAIHRTISSVEVV